MELTKFIESHDKAILAIEKLGEILKDNGFTGALDYITDIEKHINLVETDYLEEMQLLATGE
ncbi:hypothetical protein P7J53_01905 [Streptococcus suis]|uniref:hypothetical protein n=1 Tax=Streptococcus suis TaxID=1307 RepID=UPI0038BB2D3D